MGIAPSHIPAFHVSSGYVFDQRLFLCQICIWCHLIWLSDPSSLRWLVFNASKIWLVCGDCKEIVFLLHVI